MQFMGKQPTTRGINVCGGECSGGNVWEANARGGQTGTKYIRG